MGTADNERKLQKYIVNKPGIPLHEGEVCYYRGEAYSYRNHVVTTGSTGLGGGFSFHVAKHVTYHTGAGTSARIRENVPDYYPGVFYMTNQRLIMLSENLGFDMPIYKMTSVQTDGKMYRFFFGSKQYTIVPEEYKKIKKIMFLIEKPETPPEWENKKSSGKSTSSATERRTENASSPADEILKYKKLLDAGAISQEEYDSVKSKLLGTVASTQKEVKSSHTPETKTSEAIKEPPAQPKIEEPKPVKPKEDTKPSVFSQMLGSVVGSVKEELSRKEVSDDFQLPDEKPIFSSGAGMDLDAWGHSAIGELRLYKDYLIFVSDDNKFKKKYRLEMISKINALSYENLNFLYGSDGVNFRMNNKVKKEWKKQLKEAISNL